ncbi:MAG: glycosyltransferase [Magnetococcales bacterium]|nr:glycosyltransferase [Magnetococcales bacterium]MBF0321327.1 glycosyltransferase [Magnetococcales bacterium]
MRILLTADPFLPVPPLLYGGIERVIDALVAGLRRKGHGVGLVAHPESTVAADAFFPWPTLQPQQSQWRLDHLNNVRALFRAVRLFQPEVLHSFSRILYLSPFLLLRRPPMIMTFERPISFSTTRWAHLLAGKALTFTCCSADLCQKGQRAGGIWQPIHNFVELGTFTFREHVPDHAPLVFLSRVERLKGAHTAMAIAKQAGRRLIIAGNHAESGPEEAYWRCEILPCLGRDGIEYIGPVNDAQKNALLGQAAAMVVPIEWDEPFGIVFAESLACGTPVISTPRGALPEIVREGVDGFLIRSVEEGCLAVAKLAAVDRNNCRQRAETLFSEAVILDQYEALYRRVAVAGRNV